MENVTVSLFLAPKGTSFNVHRDPFLQESVKPPIIIEHSIDGRTSYDQERTGE